MKYIIVVVIVFAVLEFVIRKIIKYLSKKQEQKTRLAALNSAVSVQNGRGVSTLKRVDVINPKAKILCIDSDEKTLDKLRNILVLDGFTVDTLMTGNEAKDLIGVNHYDFTFIGEKLRDIKASELAGDIMSRRPDIDVIIMTEGKSQDTPFALIKGGALDFIQKPNVDDRLTDFVLQSLIKRENKIKASLKQKKQVISSNENSCFMEFSIPGGVFIAPNHTWMWIRQDGKVNVGIDDFAVKVVGKIDSIEFPNLGMQIEKGQTLFVVRQGTKELPFASPVSGKVWSLNKKINDELDYFAEMPYESNWLCVIDSEVLDKELPGFKLGQSAVEFYESDIKILKQALDPLKKDNYNDNAPFCVINSLKNEDWDKVSKMMFAR